MRRGDFNSHLSSGRTQHIEKVLNEISVKTRKYILPHHLAHDQSQVVQKWEEDFDKLVSEFDSLPLIVQYGIKELAYFYRSQFDRLMVKANPTAQAHTNMLPIEERQAYCTKILVLLVSLWAVLIFDHIADMCHVL